METGEPRTGERARAGLAFGLLAALLYGRHLADGFLADDFLYLHWAREGLAGLLRHVTVDSSPQMIRPLPALVWGLGGLGAGAAFFHALSLLLHVANGLLVLALVRRGGGAPAPALAAAALFVAFPLFLEPVVWASASFDLWACFWALAAAVTAAGTAGEGRGRAAVAAGAAALFLLALLSKESVILLPLLLPLLLPWRRVRGPVAAMAAVAGLYLAARLALFGGPGGYLDPAGRPELFGAEPLQVLRSLGLRLPFRVLVPFKRPGELAPVLLAASAVLFAALALSVRGAWGRGLAARLGRAPGAGLLALLPVLPLFSIDVDQEGSRMAYFPAAVVLAGLGMAVRDLGRAARLAAGALLLYWAAACLWNGRAWAEASREVERTLAGLARVERSFPPGARVLVAGHDSWRGAYVWRNGLTAAAGLAGLRGDLLWTYGTAATVDDPAGRLGRDLFEAGLAGLGAGPGGELVDWTPCARALLAEPARPLASWPVTPAAYRGSEPVAEVVLPLARLAEPAAALQVRLRLAPGCRPPAPAEGRLGWLPFDSRRFQRTSSLPFAVGPATPGEVVVRLFPEPAPLTALTLKVDLPRELLPCLVEARVAGVPEACLRPPGR